MSFQSTKNHDQVIMNDKRLRVNVNFAKAFYTSDAVKEVLASDLPKDTQGICIDSRVLEAGDLFFAIKGEAGADGHDYVKDALNKGASAAVVSKDVASVESSLLIHVDDTLKAFQNLATAWRKAWGKNVLAITGSNGKTSAKYLCYQLLKLQYRITPPRNSWNNHLGVPLSLFSIQNDDEVHVLELGMNHPGEIYPLSEIAQPTIAAITNIGRAHIGFFDSIEGIAKEKKQLFEWLSKNKSSDSQIVINIDDARLAPVRDDEKFKDQGIAFSVDQDSADIYALTESGEAMIQYGSKGKLKNSLNLLGRHNLSNALLALAVAYSLNVKANDVQSALENLYLPDLRQETVKLSNNVTLLVDCYNANLDSSLVAVKMLGEMQQEHKIVVLGDMAENGAFSKENHLTLAKAIESDPSISVILCFGEETKVIANYFSQNDSKQHSQHFESKNDLLNVLKQEIRQNSAVLFKGSRSNALETVVESLQHSPEYRRVS